MQIETTISTLYNVKKCLEEKLNDMKLENIFEKYIFINIIEGNVKEHHKEWCEKFRNLYYKIENIKVKLDMIVNKL